MKGFLSLNQIDYVIFHLGLTIEMDAGIREKFIFCQDPGAISRHSNCVIFLLSKEEFSLARVQKIKGLDVLFPNPDNKSDWEITGSNLVFCQDYLKSAFYLLSGYQEYNSMAIDSLGRFDYLRSVQHQLDITGIPLVNYYFETICKGLQAFFNAGGHLVSKKDLVKTFGFMLTHDVDRVKLYNLNNFIYCGKALLGFAGKNTTVTYRLASFIDSFTGFFKTQDPHWTFPFLAEAERQYQFRSVYFFLDRLQDQVNFKINSGKIRTLIASLEREGNEIGIHGTVESVHSKKEALGIKHKLQQLVKNKIIGNRNHMLLFSLPGTMKMLKDLDYRYDSTLGFADHEGFRNSFCHPFKLFDFEKDTMIDLWEVPMTLMDCTLFDYRKLDFIQAMRSVDDLIAEIKKFRGIFTLLWHNSYFEERRYPGITEFYSQLLARFRENDAVCVTGRELISLLRKNKM